MSKGALRRCWWRSKHWPPPDRDSCHWARRILLTMLSFRSSHTSPTSIGRREFLRIGGLGLGGLTLSDMLGLQAAIKKGNPALKDKSVIFLFMHGGPSQFETFDPKMDAPARDPQRDGRDQDHDPRRHVRRHVPEAGAAGGQVQHRALLRHRRRQSTTSRPIVGKDTLKANMGSLYAASPARCAVTRPCRRTSRSSRKPSIRRPSRRFCKFGDFTSGGELGAAYRPFVPGAGGGPQADMTLNLPHRAARRPPHAARRARSTGSARWITARWSKAWADFSKWPSTSCGAACRMRSISRRKTRASSPATTPRRCCRRTRINQQWKNHDHYADNAASLGKLLLLARRLCERGCGFVTVTTSFVWDMHADVNNAPVTKGMDYVGRPFDHAVSAFIEDVEARGLRDKILLVCCGEMGRTPRINAKGGRDHWGNLAPLMLYGGGTEDGPSHRPIHPRRRRASRRSRHHPRPRRHDPAHAPRCRPGPPHRRDADRIC